MRPTSITVEEFAVIRKFGLLCAFPWTHYVADAIERDDRELLDVLIKSRDERAAKKDAYARVCDDWHSNSYEQYCPCDADTPLKRYVVERRIDLIPAVFEAGIDNSFAGYSRDPNHSNTALQIAVRARDCPMVDLLLTCKNILRDFDFFDAHPLVIAIAGGDLEMLQTLGKYAQDIITGENSWILLQEAQWREHEEIEQWLLDNGANTRGRWT